LGAFRQTARDCTQTGFTQLTTKGGLGGCNSAFSAPFAVNYYIFILCRKTKSILITRDYHFTNAIRFPTKDTEGIIYIRHGNLTSNEEIELVNQFLNTHPLEWIRSKLVILSKEGIT